MKKRFRLTPARDFQRLMTGRRVFSGRSLVGFGNPREDGRQRVGVAAGRRLGGAVVRNRAKRRLREAARHQLLVEDSNLSAGGIGYDVILIARSGALTLPMSVLESEAAAVVARIRKGSITPIQPPAQGEKG